MNPATCPEPERLGGPVRLRREAVGRGRQGPRTPHLAATLAAPWGERPCWGETCSPPLSRPWGVYAARAWPAEATPCRHPAVAPYVR